MKDTRKPETIIRELKRQLATALVDRRDAFRERDHYRSRAVAAEDDRDQIRRDRDEWKARFDDLLKKLPPRLGGGQGGDIC